MEEYISGQIPDWMLLDAVRYSIGRRSVQVQVTCQWLVAHWRQIPARVQALLRQDLDEAFRRDDNLRAAGEISGLALGMDIDRECWERVRALWQEEE